MCFSLLHRRPPFVYDGESDEMARLRILRAAPLYDAQATPLSRGAKACLSSLLTCDWRARSSAEEALADPWLRAAKPPPRERAARAQAVETFEVEWEVVPDPSAGP